MSQFQSRARLAVQIQFGGGETGDFEKGRGLYSLPRGSKGGWVCPNRWKQMGGGGGPAPSFQIAGPPPMTAGFANGLWVTYPVTFIPLPTVCEPANGHSNMGSRGHRGTECVCVSVQVGGAGVGQLGEHHKRKAEDSWSQVQGSGFY